MGLFVRVEGSFLEFEGGDVSMFQEGLGLKRETLGKPDVCLFFALTLLSPSIIYYIRLSPPPPHTFTFLCLSFLFCTLLHFPVEGSLIAHLD